MFEIMMCREIHTLFLWHAQVDLSKRPFLVKSSDREYLAETVIISTGAVAKRMNFPGSDEDNGFWCVYPRHLPQGDARDRRERKIRELHSTVPCPPLIPSHFLAW